MPQKVYEIDLDIKNPEYKLVPYVEVVSGDTDANIFNIQLLENFSPLNASGNTAVIIFEKPDKTTVFQNLTIVDATTGKYTCTLSSQTIVVPGRIKAEVALYEGTKKITSTKFEFIVRKSLLNENTVESSNEFTALTEALGTVNQYDSRITSVEQDQAAHLADNVHIGKNEAVKAYHNANQSLPNNAETYVTLNSEHFDNANMHDNAMNNFRLTCKAAGKYLINANIRFATNPTGVRAARILKNRDSVICGMILNAVNGDTSEINISTVAELAVNDFIEIRANQTSGGALDLIYTNGMSPEFMMVRVG